MDTKSSTTGQANRSVLAGERGRQVGGAEEKGEARAKGGAVGEFLKSMACAPTELAPDDMSRVLAVLVAEIVNAFEPVDTGEMLAVIANRLDGHSRRRRGGAAAMLGAVGAALMMMEA